jgi:glucokinase
MKHHSLLGIDVGGTKIRIGKVTDGKITDELYLLTQADKSEDMIISDIIEGIKKVISPEVTGIGIGVPGLVDEVNGIVYNVTNIPSWKEVHLKKKIESYFNKPVQLANDANCFALGEKVFGKGRKYHNLVGLTIGTGVGTGIIINDKIYSGTFSLAGEFGGIPYLQHTCEYYCSGQFFSECHATTGQAIYERALAGDRKAIKIFDEYGEHLGNLIKTILLALGPQIVILGGSVTQSYRFFHKSMMESISKLPFRMITDHLVIEISTNEKIAVLGAAALMYEKEIPYSVN